MTSTGSGFQVRIPDPPEKRAGEASGLGATSSVRDPNTFDSRFIGLVALN